MKKVLILHNSVIMPSDLLSRLEYDGYLPFCSLFSEINAIKSIEIKQYDVVLLVIPEMSVGGIRHNKYLNEISRLLPVILVTSFIDTTILESLDKLCLYGCLVSPFSDEQLCSTIELSCHNHKLSKRCNSGVEKALVESERSYAMLLSNLPGMAYTCDNDRDWTMRFVSEGCYKLTGYEPESLINSKDLAFNDLITVEYKDRVWQKWQSALSRKESFQDEYTIITASGELKWVWEQGKGVYDDEGKIIAIEGFITDITEQKKAEEALRESESRYRSLFENKHSVMLIVEPETGAILDANPAALSFYGWSLEEFRRKNIMEINALSIPDVKKELNCAIKHQINHFFFKHRLADGSIRDVEVFSGPIIMEGRILLYSIINDITERNKFDQELRLNHFVIDHATIGIFRIDEDGNIVSVNDYACDSLGYSREELCQMNVLDIDPTFTFDKWLGHRLKMRQMKSETVETIHRRKDGTEFPVDVTINYMEYEGKLFSVSFAKNITKRKLAEKALMESEELFRTTLYSIGDGVITTDTNGCLRQMNHVAEKLTGWLEKEAMGKPLEVIFRVINEDTRQQVEIPVRKVLREGQIVGLANHTLLISKDNREIPIADSGSPIINQKGDITGVVLVFRDQTEERVAQKALMESEARFRKLVVTAPEAIFVQTEGCFTYVNPAALRLFGAESQEQLLGKSILERIHPDYRDIVRERMHLVNNEQQNVPAIEEVYLRLDGTSFTVELSVMPLNYDGLNGALVFFRDITERKQLEMALLRAKMISDEANRTKNEFLANTSHELRTPLNSIIGFSDLLLDGEMDEITEKQRKYIRIINESGHLLLNIINRILDISSIDYGQMNLNYTKFNLCNAIQDTCVMMQTLANRKSIELIVDVDSRINEINADIVKFKEIVSNLVDNSVKFTPNGGTVVVSAIQNENGVEVSVTDTGIGISEEHIGKIFDPFFQVDSSTTRRYGGTGLGLALIKQFIVMHGGNIWVKSEPSKGTRFSFTIPIQGHSSYPKDLNYFDT
ncbi:PAS domain S-box protein [uncultured Methanomethylovorans sp.]|uniref:PAS domain S-box protein n=1 Tax=uncultured Methanomethylovorans sp. TaxID=183759 RepID=UPI002AA82B89|nr:PAS domain S-box protein [uncultured Methanomethylovorans sp.]